MSGSGRWKAIWTRRGGFSLKKYGLMIGFVFLGLIISILTPNFLSSTNLLNILRQSSIVGVMAIGTTFVIIGGGFDISVGSLLALTAAMSLKLQQIMPWYAVVILVLAAGAFFGAVNGVLTAKLHIVAIITTLGTMTILRGSPTCTREATRSWAARSSSSSSARATSGRSPSPS